MWLRRNFAGPLFDLSSVDRISGDASGTWASGTTDQGGRREGQTGPEMKLAAGKRTPAECHRPQGPVLGLDSWVADSPRLRPARTGKVGRARLGGTDTLQRQPVDRARCVAGGGEALEACLDVETRISGDGVSTHGEEIDGGSVALRCPDDPRQGGDDDDEAETTMGKSEGEVEMASGMKKRPEAKTEAETRQKRDWMKEAAGKTRTSMHEGRASNTMPGNVRRNNRYYVEYKHPSPHLLLVV